MKCSIGISNFLEKFSAAAAKSCQSCPTLCNPIDGSPPGSPVPGILQARTLEWVAISFSVKSSLVFPILLFSSISLHCSLRKSFLSLLSVLWSSAFRWVYISFSSLPLVSFIFWAICEASSDNYFAFCISFSWGWSWSLPPVQCYKASFIVLQAFYQI